MKEELKSGQPQKPAISKSRMAPGRPIINLTYLLTICPHDPSFITEIMSLFKKQSIEFLATSRAQLVAGAYDQLARNVHSFKPQGAYLGVEELKDLLGTLEMEARTSRNTQRMEVLLADVEKLILLMVTEIDTRYKKPILEQPHV